MSNNNNKSPLSVADALLFDIDPKIRQKAINSADRTDPRDCDDCKTQLFAIAGGWECPVCGYTQTLLKTSTSK
jgi:uncharacterized Zn finger protein (UPF0148 family)